MTLIIDNHEINHQEVQLLSIKLSPEIENAVIALKYKVVELAKSLLAVERELI